MITLTMIAAPENPSARPLPPKPVEIKPLETPVPIEAVKQLILPESVPSPQPMVPIPGQVPPIMTTTLEINIRGDSSSVKAGPDATTVKARPSLLAKPNYLKNPEPSYPPLARRRHQEGLVLLTVKVTAQGRASEVVLKQSSGFSLLDDAALQAVRDWEFEPARIGPFAMESEIEVPVRFKLTD